VTASFLALLAGSGRSLILRLIPAHFHSVTRFLICLAIPEILICNKHALEHSNFFTFQTSCLNLVRKVSLSNATRAVQTSEMLDGAGSPKEVHV
jgi:hypothetical protein